MAHPQLTTGQAPRPLAFQTVFYNSSVDNFSLSYEEWLPTAFVPTSSYSLAVFLHGMQGAGPWQVGGVQSEIVPLLNNSTTSDGLAVGAILRTAISANQSYILIAPNTRTGAGFYANSPCGGPQEQDLLDAIQHEKQLRHVLRTYLLGFSMGSVGALALAASHPHMFAGVATAGTITDAFAAIAYRAANQHSAFRTWANLSYQTMIAFTCGVVPGAGDTTVDADEHQRASGRQDPHRNDRRDPLDVERQRSRAIRRIAGHEEDTRRALAECAR
ncbi:MAG: hypothetical protein L3J73_03930, partial [Thermoplasmata archaeon]|nr:hypothetical protein [Thermoplasmata archaeon]